MLKEANRNSCLCCSHELVCSKRMLVFSRQARGSILYNVPLSEIKEGLKFRCELEPFNARD